MATLIVPDIHEKLDRLLSIEERYFPKADRIVMLGDFFDRFGPVDLDLVGRICGWIIGHMQDPRITWILANHDCHYFFRNAAFQCSGYEPRKQEMIDANLPDGFREKFQISTRVGPYLVSHAGYTEQTLQYCRPEIEAEALKRARVGSFDALFGAGRARGGHQLFGGPTWLDWNYEFEHIDGVPQIVGHTQGRAVRIKGPSMTYAKYKAGGSVVTHEPGLKSYCIDTSLRHVMWVDEETGATTVEEVA